MRKITVFLFLMSMILGACTAAPVEQETPAADMPNPASVYCEEKGGTLEIITEEDGSQSGVCLFPDGSQCDEWAYFRGECQPGDSLVEKEEILPAIEGTPSERVFLTPAPIDPAEYEGWWEYTHPEYGFSLQLPLDWVVDETTAEDPLLSGHKLMLHANPEIPGGPQIRMTFRQVGEDVLLWPTGVGAGEFIAQGTLDIAGQPIRRMLFVCPTGEVNEIFYQGENQANIQRGNLEFAFILSLSDIYCQAGYSLEGKNQHVGEMVIASLALP